MTDTAQTAAPAAPRVTPREGFVEAAGSRLRYLEAGDGAPVVQIPGGSGAEWTRAHEILAATYRVLVVELPGMGQSAANPQAKLTRDLARIVDAAMTNFGLEKYSLLGSSFGGHIAAWLAVQFPDHLDALIRESPAAIVPEGGLPSGGTPEQRAARMFAHPEQVTLPPIDPEVLTRNQAFMRQVQGLSRDPDLEARLGEITAPTLVLFGTKDGVISPDLGRVYRERIPNSHFMLVYDAAHRIQVDRPEAFCSVVSDYLERHEVFVVSNANTLINP